MRQAGVGARNLCAGLVIAAALASCGAKPSAQKSVPPAEVSGHVAESDLVTVKLTEEAERRLDIKVAPVERRKVAQTRTLGGEVISPADGASALTRYSATVSMDPTALATAQIAADGAVERAKIAVELARTRYERYARLYAAKTESARARDDALAELRTAQATLETAEAQRALLGQSVGSTSAPESVWVRASVYTGDLARLNREASAQVSSLGTKSASRPARPLSASATASALSATAFLFYEVDNSDGAFRMGERVDVTIPTTGARETLTVPWSAILYDINGGEWVYERTAEHVYSRRRVELRAVVGDIAILARGPREGAQIVSVGGPELFGTEFGVSH